MKKRYYEIGQVFSLGRGLFQVQRADEYSYFKGTECSNCAFRMTRKACNILACHADERKDGKDVIFEIL